MNVLKSLLAALLLVLGLVATSGVVQARTYGGVFDPTIPDIGYMVGNFLYVQDDACRSIPDGLSLVVGSCDPNQHISTLTVNIFDDSDVLLASLNYAPPPNAPNAFYQFNGLPFGIDTDFIGPRFDLPAFGPQPFYLSFSMFLNPDLTPGAPAFLPVVGLYGGTCGTPGSVPPLGCQPGALITQAFDLRFFEIPEPGTLAIVLGGLVALGIARRRSA